MSWPRKTRFVMVFCIILRLHLQRIYNFYLRRNCSVCLSLQVLVYYSIDQPQKKKYNEICIMHILQICTCNVLCIYVFKLFSQDHEHEGMFIHIRKIGIRELILYQVLQNTTWNMQVAEQFVGNYVAFLTKKKKKPSQIPGFVLLSGESYLTPVTFCYLILKTRVL